MTRLKLTLLLVAVIVPSIATAKDLDGTLQHGADKRSYTVHSPKQPLKGDLPLVMVFHGGGGRAENARRMSGMNQVADREGFFVVYPDGMGRMGFLTWNAGNCCGYALDHQVDDVGFIRDLIEQLVRQYPIDRKRIYATGMSNGGMMSYRLACELSDQIAAIAPVAGAMNLDCRARHRVAVMAIHGASDKHVLYNGGQPIKLADKKHPRTDTAVLSTMQFWSGHNGCKTHLTRKMNQEVSIDEWTGCAQGADVMLYTLHGFGHAWPSGARGIADDPTSSINASEQIWAFFKNHSKF